MNTQYQDIAIEILDTVKNVFLLIEKRHPEAIFCGYRFNIENKDGKKIITPTPDFEEIDEKYYIETPQLRGVIIRRRKTQNYCIRASVNYKEDSRGGFWFAKIEIEQKYGSIGINGCQYGGWMVINPHDRDLSNDNSETVLSALIAMKNHLQKIYNQFLDDSFDIGSYDSPSQRVLIPYNPYKPQKNNNA